MDTISSSTARDSAVMPVVQTETSGPGQLTVTVTGRLDSMTIGDVWRRMLAGVGARPGADVVLDAGGITYCDISGAGLLIDFQRRLEKAGARLEIQNLEERFEGLLAMFDVAALDPTVAAPPQPANLPEEVGRATVGLWEQVRAHIAFLGELLVALVHTAFHPLKLRWKDAFLVAERAGVNCLPIVALISFMIGWIIAFQSAIPMRQFGAEIFVADLLGIVVLRELGPLMTALLLAGRSGSAFAAELGTMKVNEEIDALTTMGLDPVRFLATTRVLAATAMTPLLAAFGNLVGLVGGAVVMMSMGFPLVTYTNRVVAAVSAGDLLGGLVKAAVFGFIVAGIGCFRGLRTKTGASAVGESTTGAVVTSVILIIVVDAIFAVVFFSLGI